MLGADTCAAALHHWMSDGECIDRLVTRRTADELCAHAIALRAPDDVCQKVAELEPGARLGQEDVRQPVH